jgi:hypothetical protein
MSRAEEVVARAIGDFPTDYITQTNSVSVPIIDQLAPDEQLHFVFFNRNKGFRIFEPDGEELTPDHTVSGESKCFLLITDARLIYLVGQPDESEDRTQSFEYDQIIKVEVDSGLVKNELIELFTDDGRKYRFVNLAIMSATLEEGAKYIRLEMDSVQSNKAENNNSKDSENESSTDTNQTTSANYCTNCGAKMSSDSLFCGDCGSEIGSGNTDTNQEYNPGATADTIAEKVSDKSDEKWQSEYSTFVWVTSGIVALITFPLGLMIPAYFYFKASKGDGSSQSTAEIATVLLFNVLGMIVVELIGVNKIITFFQLIILGLMLLGIASYFGLL